MLRTGFPTDLRCSASMIRAPLAERTTNRVRCRFPAQRCDARFSCDFVAVYLHTKLQIDGRENCVSAYRPERQLRQRSVSKCARDRTRAGETAVCKAYVT